MHVALTELINQLSAEKVIRADGAPYIGDYRMCGRDLASRFDATARRLRDCSEIWANLHTVRSDADESAFLARSLLQVQAKQVEQMFTKLKAPALIPVDTSLSPGADVVSTPMNNQVGKAEIISNYGNGFPMVEVSQDENLSPVRSLGIGYAWTIQDLRRSAMAGGTPLDQRRANTARMAHERLVERVAAYGDSRVSIPGFLTAAQITIINKASGGSLPNITGGWETATASQIYTDLGIMAAQVSIQSNDLFEGNTMVLPLAAFEIAARMPYSTLSSTSVLRAFLDSNPHVKNIDTWAMCDNKDENGLNPISNGTKTRAAVYDRNPNVLDQKIPQAFEQFSPQQVNLQFNVPCHSRHGGTLIYYPAAVCYVDDLVSVPAA